MKMQAHRFCNYINFDWDTDSEWKEYAKEKIPTGKNVSKRDEENYKRCFYKEKVDPRFDAEFFLKDDLEQKKFLEMCKFFGSIGSLNISGLRNLTKTEKIYDILKRICYLIAFMWIPVNYAGYSAMILAIIFSVLSRKRFLSKNG
jgi:hypothetical protein